MEYWDNAHTFCTLFYMFSHNITNYGLKCSLGILEGIEELLLNNVVRLDVDLQKYRKSN